MTMQVLALLTPPVMPQNAIRGQTALTEYPEGQQQNYQDDLATLLATMDAALAQLESEVQQLADGVASGDEHQDLAQSMLPLPLLFAPAGPELKSPPVVDLYALSEMPASVTKPLLTTEYSEQTGLSAGPLAVSADTIAGPLRAMATTFAAQPADVAVQNLQSAGLNTIQAFPAQAQALTDLTLSGSQAGQQSVVVTAASTATPVLSAAQYSDRHAALNPALPQTIGSAPPTGQSQSAALHQLVADVSVPVTAAVQSSAQATLPVWQADPLPAQSQHWGQRLVQMLADKVDLQLGLNVNKAMIRLDPPSLGTIELSVQLDGDRLTVQMHSSNAQLRDAMGQGLDLLRASLQQKLGAEVQIDLRMGSESSSQQQQRNAEQQLAQQTESNFYAEAEMTLTETSQPNRLNLVNQLV